MVWARTVVRAAHDAVQFLVSAIKLGDQLFALPPQQRDLALALFQDLLCLGAGVFHHPVGFLDRGRAELLVHAAGLFPLAAQQRDGFAASGVQCEPKVALDLRASRLRVRPRLRALRLRVRPRPRSLRFCRRFCRGGGLLDLLGMHPSCRLQLGKDPVSKITDKVLEEMNESAQRPLDAVYPVIFIDALYVKVRDGQVTNRPFYVVIGVTVDGHRDILGIWAGEGGNGGEGAKFWLQVLTEIKNRGVGDVCIAVCDGLKGMREAITTAWPQTVAPDPQHLPLRLSPLLGADGQRPQARLPRSAVDGHTSGCERVMCLVSGFRCC
jgi:mutator family transposase